MRCYGVHDRNLKKNLSQIIVVVVNHVTTVAIGHRVLKKFWPMVLGCVLRTAGSSIIQNYADPLTSLELLNIYLTLAMSSGSLYILRISCNWVPQKWRQI